MANPTISLDAAGECAEKLGLLANPVRLAVMRLLRDGEASVNALIDSVGVEQNLMSHHLRLLREAGLVRARRDGKSVKYSLGRNVSLADRDSIDLGCCRLSFSQRAKRMPS